MHGMQNGMMLNDCGDEMFFPVFFHFMSDAFYRPIIRLCTAGGEINIHRTGMNQRSDLFPRILHRFMGIAADSVKGGCISVILCKIRYHRLKCHL